MKKILIVALLFCLLVGRFTLIGKVDISEKIVFLNQANAYPLSSNGKTKQHKIYEGTTLLFELKHNLDPNSIWNEFEELHGEITDNNVNSAIVYYQQKVKEYLYDIKYNFQKETKHVFTESELYSSSPYFTIHLDYKVKKAKDLGVDTLAMVANTKIHKTLVMPYGGIPPLDELDPGGGGSSSCEYAFSDVKTAIDYEYPYSVGYTTLTGDGSNVGILEPQGGGMGFVDPDYSITVGPGGSTTVSIFADQQVDLHPYYYFLIDGPYSDNLFSNHANTVARIAAGYNGIASNSLIYSSLFLGDIEIDMQTLSYVPLSTADYFTNSYVDVVNASFGITTNDDEVIKHFNSFVYLNQIPIIAAAGNSSEEMVSFPSAAYNVFSVGGTNTDGSEFYDYSNSSTAYINNVLDSFNYNIDKPNIVAPAVMELKQPCTNIPNNIIHGTSLATPLVTGAISLLLEKRPLLKAKPAEIYALLMATASNDAYQYPLQSYNGFIGDMSGAGVLQIGTLLDHSSMSLTKTFNSNTSMLEEIIYNFNPTNSSKTLKVSTYWLAKIENNQQVINNYKLEVFFNDQLIGISDSDINNFQLIIDEINTSGILMIRVTRLGSFSGSQQDNVAIAWSLT